MAPVPQKRITWEYIQNNAAFVSTACLRPPWRLEVVRGPKVGRSPRLYTVYADRQHRPPDHDVLLAGELRARGVIDWLAGFAAARFMARNYDAIANVIPGEDEGNVA